MSKRRRPSGPRLTSSWLVSLKNREPRAQVGKNRREPTRGRAAGCMRPAVAAAKSKRRGGHDETSSRCTNRLHDADPRSSAEPRFGSGSRRSLLRFGETFLRSKKVSDGLSVRCVTWLRYDCDSGAVGGIRTRVRRFLQTLGPRCGTCRSDEGSERRWESQRTELDGLACATLRCAWLYFHAASE